MAPAHPALLPCCSCSRRRSRTTSCSAFRRRPRDAGDTFKCKGDVLPEHPFALSSPGPERSSQAEECRALVSACRSVVADYGCIVPKCRQIVVGVGGARSTRCSHGRLGRCARSVFLAILTGRAQGFSATGDAGSHVPHGPTPRPFENARIAMAGIWLRSPHYHLAH